MKWSYVLTGAVLSIIMASSAFGESKGDSAMRRIEDRQAIEQLLMGDYPRALDTNNWAAYASFFAKDGTLIMNGGAVKETGPAAIQKYFDSRPAARTDEAASACPVPAGANRSLHIVSDVSIKIDGDTATDQAYYQTIVTRDCKAVIGGAGHYVDVLKREDGHWKFLKREIVGDLPPKMATVQTAARP